MSNAPKCMLNNGVSIVQKLVKLSNTSTTFSQLVKITLSKCLRVWQVFERWTHLGAFDTLSHLMLSLQ